MPTAAILDNFASLNAEVVLEIPTEDDQMIKTLKRHKRAGTFDAYSLDTIEAQAAERFVIAERVVLPGGTRVLLHLQPR